MKYVLVDRYLALEPGRRARAVRAVTRGEDVFDDGRTSFPETLVLEAMAQTAGMLCAATAAWRRKMVLAKVEAADFPGTASPGARLDLEADLTEEREGTYRVRTTAAVGGAPIATAVMLMRGLEIDSEEGRAFDTPSFRTARAENLRLLGVTALVEPPAP